MSQEQKQSNQKNSTQPNIGTAKVLFKLGDEVTFKHKGVVVGVDEKRPFFYLVVEDVTNKQYTLYINNLKFV